MTKDSSVKSEVAGARTRDSVCCLVSRLMSAELFVSAPIRC